MEIAFTVSVGLLASFIAGLFGIGGGILLMPALLYLFSHTAITQDIDPIHLAINTSMVITFLNASFSLRQQLKYKNVSRELVVSILPGSLFGVALGVLFSHLLSATHVQLFAGILFLLLALLTVSSLFHIKQTEKLTRNRLAVLGFVASAPASFLGLGGGSVLVPLLNHFGVDIKKVVGVSVTSTVITLFITLVVTLLLDYAHSQTWSMALQIIDWKTILYVFPVMFVGVWLGSHVLQKINPFFSKVALSVLLAIIGLWILL